MGDSQMAWSTSVNDGMLDGSQVNARGVGFHFIDYERGWDQAGLSEKAEYSCAGARAGEVTQFYLECAYAQWWKHNSYYTPVDCI